MIVVDGFSKAYGVTGWRLGWVHGPAAIIDKMTMLQQYTFVCAPHPLQWAAVAALDVDMSPQAAEYAQRRDLVVAGLRDAGYEVADTGGAFYVFPKVPAGQRHRRKSSSPARSRTNSSSSPAASSAAATPTSASPTRRAKRRSSGA